MIPYGQHQIEQDDIDAVVEVLKNQFLTQGTQVPAFEKALCEYTKAQYALTLNSATSALHIACLALGVKPGDRVWTSPITFVASANSARFCGADIDFVDIDPDTRNLCPAQLSQKLKRAKTENTLPKVIIIVHFAGQSCDMQTIAQLAQQYDIRIIEDACHALGGDYLDRKIGGCQFSDITTFSFHPVKSMTTGEGGALLTNHAQLHKKACLLAKHGVDKTFKLEAAITDIKLDTKAEIKVETTVETTAETKTSKTAEADSAKMNSVFDGAWCYQQTELGYNFRMSDINAALGLTQLQKLPKFIQKRRNLAQRYFELLADLAHAKQIQLPDASQLNNSAWHLFTICILTHQRKSVYDKLQAAGIGVNVHYIPVHLQPYYQQLGFKMGDFPQAEQYYRGALTLPLFQTMTFEQQDKVVAQLKIALAYSAPCANTDTSANTNSRTNSSANTSTSPNTHSNINTVQRDVL